MAIPRYKLKVTLRHHTETITALQFSPSGDFLASGSENGVVLVFSTGSWKPVKRFIDASPVTALVWHPLFPKTILCGFDSGDIHTACFEGNESVESETLRKVWSDPMNGMIHCLVFNQDGTMMAIGHGAELSIVRVKTISTWSAMRRLPDPPSLPGLDRDEVLPPPLVRSLHFIDDGKMLVVAYLDHGFVCWNVNSLEMSWHLVPRTCCIGRSTISLDQKTLVVSNLYDGLDWYNIPDRAFSRAVPIRITRNKPLPVLFIDDGDAIIIGGSSGEVRILDSRTAETLQTLEHDPDDLIQALDFYLDSKRDSRLIATGVSESGQHTKIRIWEAVTERRPKTPDLTPGPVTADERSSYLKRYLLRIALFVFIYILSLYLAVLEDTIRAELGTVAQWAIRGIWSVVDPVERSGVSGETVTPAAAGPLPTTITMQPHEGTET